MKSCRSLVAGTALAVLASGVVLAQSMSGWRGNGTGCYPETHPPTVWSATSNVVWKTALTNWSNASPLVVGDRVLVCAEPSTLICLSIADGKPLWERPNTYMDVIPEAEIAKAKEDVQKAAELRAKCAPLDQQLKELTDGLKKTPDDAALKQKHAEVTKQVEAVKTEINKYSTYVVPDTHPTNGHSTPTPTSDGQHVYVLFGTGVAACYDLDGKRQWARIVEKGPGGWGSCASPLLVGNILVVHINNVFGLDKNTGNQVWKLPSGCKYGSPVWTRLGTDDVAVTACGDVIRVADGKVITNRVADLTYCAVVVESNVAYFIQKGGCAFKLPASADAPGTGQKLWMTNPVDERYYASPVCHDGLIYAIMQKGSFSVIDAATGAIIYERKLDIGGTVFPSIALAGGYIYVSSDNGRTVVIAPGREYKEVARNDLEAFRCSPVFFGKRMLIRGMKNLYCIGE